MRSHVYVVHAMKSRLHELEHIYQTIKILQITKQDTVDDCDSTLHQQKGCTIKCKTRAAPRAMHTPLLITLSSLPIQQRFISLL